MNHKEALDQVSSLLAAEITCHDAAARRLPILIDNTEQAIKKYIRVARALGIETETRSKLVRHYDLLVADFD